MGLIKATLQKLPSASKGSPGKEIPVQFNPTSLRISGSNQTEAGGALGVRTRQYLATGIAKLTLQLVFDTADEGTTATPVSVRTLTRQVTQFLEPEKQGKKQAPPAIRFHWGEFIFEGIMESATEDIDLFASNGTPLRAKVDVSISGQRVKDLKLETGPGASNGAGSPPMPGESNAGPGTDGSGQPNDQTADTIGGESAPAFAARVGLDPAAWRSVASQIADPLSLPAGQAIDFSAAAGIAAGLGAASGFQAGVAAAANAVVDLARAAASSLGAENPASPGGADARQAGFALAAAGGVAPAMQSAQSERADQAAATSVRNFSSSSSASSSSPASATSASPASAGTAAAGAASGRSGQASGGGRAPAVADPRQRAYGFGVPLRARIAPAALDRTAVVLGSRVVAARASSIDPPMTDDPTVAPWVELPTDRRVSRPGMAPVAKSHSCGCGCGGGCGCGASR